MAQIGDFATSKQLVNTKGQTYKKLRPNLQSLNEQDVIRLIQDNPSIMVRPILTDSHKLIIGFNETEYQAFLDKYKNASN